MQLSPNQKLFAEIFSSFPEFKPKLDYFEKKRWALEVICFWNYTLQKAELLKCQKSPVSEHLSTVNMLKAPKHSINLHGSIFVWFFDQFERKSARTQLF